MAESTIKVSMQGVDNASNVIKKVKGQLEGLGAAANQQASQMSKGGDAIRAAMGAAQGSISGALGAAKGMTQAIQGMGVAMSTALPVAAAVAAAIYGITKAIQAHKKAQEDAAKSIRDENESLLKQASAVEKLAGAYQRLNSINRAMSDLDARIRGDESPLQRNKRELGLARAELSDTKANRNAIQAEQGLLAEAIKRNLKAMEPEEVTFLEGTSEQYTRLVEKSEVELKALSDAIEKDIEQKRKLAQQDSELLTRQRLQEKAVEALAAEGDRLAKEMAATKWADLMKRMSAGIKEWADGQKKLLTEERTGLLKQLNQLKSLAGQARMANVYSGGSHSTNLLLDRLNGGDSDSTTAEVATNVKTITDRLGQIERLMEQLQAI